MLRLNNLVRFVAIVSSLSCLGCSETTSYNDPNSKSKSRRTKLRQKRYAPVVTDSDTSSPTLTECLYSATTSEECNKKEGCVWCSEPVSGLCLTQEWAKKMSFLPFLKCDNQTTAAEE